MLAPSTFRRAGGIPVAIRAFILGGILIGLWLGLRRTGLEGRVRTVTWLAIAVPLFAWHLAVWQFAISVPLLIWIPALLRSKRIAAVLDAVSPAWLVGFQIYRLRGGVFLTRWVAGELPGVFALPAGVGDVLVGVLAVPVALLLQSGARSGRAAAHAWNVLGIVDLLVAIAIGALTTSGRLAVATPNTATRSHPLVMIPAFAVPLSLILHALSLRQLQRSARHRAASG